MQYLQNLHTHSTFCDGRDTLTEMVEEAIARGFHSIGFSKHSYMPFSAYFKTTREEAEENTRRYRAEAKRLKEVYRGRIELFCGEEVEMFSEVDKKHYDYLIGSVHYLKIDEEYVGFDRDVPTVDGIIKTYFGGDGMAFARAYYAHLAELPSHNDFDIIGHFDLLVKNNDKGGFIDEDSKAYKDLGFEAIHALKGKIPLFEVNTGTISRGYKKSPYPQMEFLKEFRENGFGATISSDCHDKRVLDCYFEESKELLRAAGFKSRFVLTANGFEEVAL